MTFFFLRNSPPSPKMSRLRFSLLGRHGFMLQPKGRIRTSDNNDGPDQPTMTFINWILRLDFGSLKELLWALLEWENMGKLWKIVKHVWNMKAPGRIVTSCEQHNLYRKPPYMFHYLFQQIHFVAAILHHLTRAEKHHEHHTSAHLPTRTPSWWIPDLFTEIGNDDVPCSDGSNDRVGKDWTICFICFRFCFSTALSQSCVLTSPSEQICNKREQQCLIFPQPSNKMLQDAP